MPEITDDIYNAQSQGSTAVLGLFGDYQDEQRSPKEMAYANREDSIVQPVTAPSVTTQTEGPKFQFSPENSLLELMNTKLAPPDPEAQAKAEKRLRNRTLFDAAGRLFTNIGDSMTLGAGGIPVKRAPSETDKKMMDYYKKIEEGLKANEDFKKEDFTRKLQSYGLWNQAKNQDRNFDQGERQMVQRSQQQKDEQAFRAGEGEKERKWRTAEGEEERKIQRSEIANRSADANDERELKRYIFNQERGFGDVNPEMEKEIMRNFAIAKTNKEFVNTFPGLFKITTENVLDADSQLKGTIQNVEKADDVDVATIARFWLEYNSKPKLGKSKVDGILDINSSKQPWNNAGTRSQPTVPAATQQQYSTAGWY